MATAILPAQEQQAAVSTGDDPELRVKGLICQVEHLIGLKRFSPELLWREFFQESLRGLKSYGAVIKLLLGYDYQDALILQLLKLNELADKHIFAILEEAGWSDVRIASAVVNLSNLKTSDRLVGVLIRIDLVSFLIASGISGSRIIRALYRSHCLTQNNLNGLLDRKWSEYYLLMAIIEAGCFNGRIYNNLLLLTDKQGCCRFNDGLIFELLELFQAPDSEIVSTFGGVGKALGQICQLCNHANWSKTRFVDACVIVGYPPGEIAFSCVGTAAGKNSGKKRNAGSEEITANKAEVIEILNRLGMSDGDIYGELDIFLAKAEFAGAGAVDYLVAVGWSPKRVISAMLARRIPEYAIMEIINKAAHDFKMKRNSYWTGNIIQSWKTSLRKLVGKQLAAVFEKKP